MEEIPANAMDTDASPVTPESSVNEPRRSQRETKRPDRYGFHACNLGMAEEPMSVNDALTRHEWADAFMKMKFGNW